MKTLICNVKDDVMECIDSEGKKSKYRKITYLTIKPGVFASTITAERVRKWLDEKGLRTIVLEYPSLLTEEEREELEKVIGWVKED